MSRQDSLSDDDGFGNFAAAPPPPAVAQPPPTPPAPQDAAAVDVEFPSSGAAEAAGKVQKHSEESLSVTAALQRFRRMERVSKEQQELTAQQLAVLEQQRLAAFSLRASHSGSLPAPSAPALSVRSWDHQALPVIKHRCAHVHHEPMNGTLPPRGNAACNGGAACVETDHSCMVAAC